MDRIIFDNVQHGFPANEKFMQIVDKNRLAILDVCTGLLGSNPAIIKGVNISSRIIGGQQKVSVSAGLIWTGSDLLSVKANELFPANVMENIYIKPVTTAEKGTFLDGVQRDAYSHSEGIVVQQGTPLPNGIKLYGLRRTDTPQYVRSKIHINTLGPDNSLAKGILRQTVFSDGVVNICGSIIVAVSATSTIISTAGIKVAQISVRNADMLFQQINASESLVYPMAITVDKGISEEDSIGGRKNSLIHFLKMTKDGSLYVYIPTDKLSVPHPPTSATYYVSVDFNFNSEI